jgi:hypothetical protein
MAEISQASIDKLNATLDRLAGTDSSYAGGGPRLPSGSNNSAIGDALARFGIDFGRHVGEFGNKVMMFNATLPDLVAGLKDLGKLAGPLGIAAAEISQFGAGVAQRLVNQLQTGANIGLGGTGNAVSFNQTLAGLRVNPEEAIKFLDQYANYLRELGPDQRAVADRFSEMSQAIANGDNGVLKRLTDMNVTTEQFNILLAQTAKRYGTVDALNRTNQQQFGEEMVKMAVTLRENTALFGTSANKQLESTKEQTDSAEVFAKTQMLRSQPGGEARAADLEKTLAITAGMPAVLRDAVNQALTRQGGMIVGPTAEAINSLNGRALTEMMRLGRIMQTGNDAERQAAMAEFRKLPAMFDNKLTQSFVANRQVSPEARQLYQELVPLFRGYNQSRAAAPGVDPYRNITETQRLQSVGIATTPQQNGTQPGQYDQGRETTVIVNQINNALKQAGVGAADAIDVVNKQMTKLGGTIDKMVNSEVMQNPSYLSDKIKQYVREQTAAGVAGGQILQDLSSQDALKRIFGIQSRADTTFGATGDPFESGSLVSSINENPSGKNREGVFSQGQIDSIVRTALISGDATKNGAPSIGEIGKVATKISDAVSSAMPTNNEQAFTGTKTQDDVVSALDGLNKTVSELVSLQRQSNKITESGLNKVADANSVYG